MSKSLIILMHVEEKSEKESALLNKTNKPINVKKLKSKKYSKMSDTFFLLFQPFLSLFSFYVFNVGSWCHHIHLLFQKILKNFYCVPFSTFSNIPCGIFGDSRRWIMTQVSKVKKIFTVFWKKLHFQRFRHSILIRMSEPGTKKYA